jgi:hypothetical protein
MGIPGLYFDEVYMLPPGVSQWMSILTARPAGGMCVWLRCDDGSKKGRWCRAYEKMPRIVFDYRGDELIETAVILA